MNQTQIVIGPGEAAVLTAGKFATLTVEGFTMEGPGGLKLPVSGEIPVQEGARVILLPKLLPPPANPAEPPH